METNPEPSTGVEAAEAFVRLLIEFVRDPSVSTMLWVAAGGSRGPTGEAWAHADPHERVRLAIATGVDEVIFRLLDAIDNGVLDLCWRMESGEMVELAGSASAELGGTYVTEGGWRDRFANELSYPGI